MFFSAIDPGQTGGMTTLDLKGLPLFVGCFDKIGAVRTILSTKVGYGCSHDDPSWCDAKCRTTGMVFGVEGVHAFPGQGVTSMFTFGTEYGKILGCLETISADYVLIAPQTWQKVVKHHPEGPKQAVKAYCEKVWGLDRFIFEGCRVPHQGAMDACCMAEYLRQLHLGLINGPKRVKGGFKSKTRRPIDIN